VAELQAAQESDAFAQAARLANDELAPAIGAVL